jgi:putative endonuclease
MDNKKVGQDGEALACSYLERKGYQIIARNFRLRNGEIDIIARRKQTVVFCEVKARNSREFGEPFEAVTRFKQERLKRLALGYLQKAESHKVPIEEFDYRFDIVSIVFGLKPEIIHIENAF